MTDRDSWCSYARRYRPHTWTVVWAIAAAALQTAFAAPMVLLVRFLFDRALPHRDFGALAASAAGIAALSLAGSGVSLWSRRRTLEATKHVVAGYREELLDRVQQAPRAWHDGTARAALHDRLVQDTERVDVMSNAILSEFLPSAAAALALFALLAWLSPPLGALLLACGGAVYLANRAVAGRLRRSADNFREAFAALSAGALFLIEKLDLIRIHTAEKVESARRKGEIDSLRTASAAFAWLDAVFSLTQSNLALLSALAVLVAGGALAMAGRMSVGALLAFYAGLGLLRGVTHSALASIPRIAIGLRALAGLEDLLHQPMPQPYTGRAACRFDGTVEFHAVDFGYTDRLVLSGLSGSIEPGCVTALAGPNGCGKSTVARLVLGFYRPRAGRLLASGTPYDQIDMPGLRREIAIVPQEPQFFPGTVRQNLVYGVAEPTPSRIEEALEFAAAREWLDSLPERLETRIGEDGLWLSGGQRQRLVLARAWLRRPKLLILDEPGNHLDALALQEVFRNLAAAPHCPAVLLITHDEELVNRADRIWRLRALEFHHA
ncbi:MAG: ABC transporter ATP-binding protein [Bryobacteraceae bacterium]